MAEWQPIETAPKDGTYIDIWTNGDFPQRHADAFFGRPHHQCGEAGQYCDSCPPDEDVWCDDFGPIYDAPTHWMLRPAHGIEKVLEYIPQQRRVQAKVRDQLSILHTVAKRLGLHEAADVIQKINEQDDKST